LPEGRKIGVAFQPSPIEEVFVLNKAVLILSILSLFVFVIGAQETQTPPPAPAQAPPKSTNLKIPAEESAKANPVKPTPESLAKGKKTYNLDCALCHGTSGDGKGDLASDIKGVVDLTNTDAMKARSDGDLLYVIKKGKGDMPPEAADRIKGEDGWNLVNYVRSFSKKKE
jgi:mono/diheme cytochrome c family protein